MKHKRQWGIVTLPDSLTLKCDNPVCGHEIVDAVLLEDMHLWIGLPCPRCGVNMLTEEDHEAAERLFLVAAWFNRWFGWLGWLLAKRETVSINPHRGELNVKREVE